MMSSVLRIMTSGILAGALIKTGSAEKIAETIVNKLGEKRAVIAIAVATMIICAVGVFIDISVITVAPIAIAIGRWRQSRQYYFAKPQYHRGIRGVYSGFDRIDD